MGVPAGIIIAWPGGTGNIPAGWTRVSALDARHTRGADAGVGGGGTGGTVAHTHTSLAHSHNPSPHTHPGGFVTGPPIQFGRSLSAGAGVDVPRSDHTHAIPALDAASATAGSATATWQHVTVEPVFYTVIWIQSNGTPPGIPAGALCWTNAASAPSGFTLHSASAGRFLKGAIAGRGGGSNGGIADTTHDHPANFHNHTPDPHTHTAPAVGGAVSAGTGFISGVPSGSISVTGHVHPITVVDTEGLNVSSTLSGPSGSATALPPYISLTAVTPIAMNASTGIIVLWAGSIASIPAGFALCDGTGGRPDCRSRMVVNHNPAYPFGTSGGAATHTHADPAAHVLTDPGHVHGLDSGGATGATSADSAQPIAASADGHAHGSAFSGSGSSLYDPAVQDVQAGDSHPPYTDVLYLQLVTVLAPVFTTPTVNEVFTDDTPTFSWGFAPIGGSPQAAYRILVYAPDGATIIYDSGEQTSAGSTHTLPVGYLHNQHQYFAQVSVTDAAGQFGLSVLVPFSIGMVPPNTAALTATAEPLVRPPDVLLAWTPPTLAVGDTFDYYTVERRVQGTLPWQAIAQITTLAVSSYRDYLGAPGITYEYAVTHTVTRTGDQVTSAEQSPPPVATLSFIGIWVHVVSNPAIWLEYLANQEKIQPVQDQRLIPVWGRTKPTQHVGELLYQGLQFGGVPEFYPTTTWQAGVLQFLQATVAEAAVLCVRMGQMQERYFCIIDIANTSRQDDLGVYETAMAFIEINYEEGALIL